MRYLVDGLVLLWAFYDPEKLNADVTAILEDDDNEFFVSAAAIWEIRAAHAQGRLTTGADFYELLETTAISVLPVTLDHAKALDALPPFHQDMFDRIQIAQARVEGLSILTTDVEFSVYDVPVRRAT